MNISYNTNYSQLTLGSMFYNFMGGSIINGLSVLTKGTST